MLGSGFGFCGVGPRVWVYPEAPRTIWGFLGQGLGFGG